MEKEVSEAERRVAIKKTYSEKISHLIKQEVNDKELYSIIRRFFADFLKLEYEFTYEELSQELNKIFIKQALKQKVDKMLEDLSWLEYMPDHELTQEEKKKILNDFKGMIEQLIIDLESKPGKKSFFDRLLGRKKEDEKVDAPQVSNDTPIEGSLPDLDLESVNQKNQDMLQELNAEMIQKEESKKTFNEFITKMGESNTLLLSPDPSETVSLNQKEKRGVKDTKSLKSKEKKNNPSLQRDQKILESGMLPQNVPQKISQNIPFNSNDDVPDVPFSKAVNPSLLTEDNDPEILAIKELIEQSYNNYFLRDVDSAKIKYMDALLLYNKFTYEKKTRIYLELYDLYKKLLS